MILGKRRPRWGPLISAAHRDTVASYVEGVPGLFEGDVPDGAGFWFPCTLVEASNDDPVARALEVGVLSINSNSSVRVSTPFGGMKQSGFGRELGLQGLEGYS